MTDDERTHSPFQILCNHRPADETFVHAREFSPPFKKKILTPFPLPTPNSPNGHVFGLYPPGGRETEERKRMGKRKMEKLLLVWAVLEEREKDLVQTIDLYIQRVFVFRPADETTEGI